MRGRLGNPKFVENAEPAHIDVLAAVIAENLWRSLKYECVYLHAWETGSQAKAAIGRWITFYNHQRPHTAHGGRPPRAAP